MYDVLLSDLSTVWDTPFTEQGMWAAEPGIRNMYRIRENELRFGEILGLNLWKMWWKPPELTIYPRPMSPSGYYLAFSVSFQVGITRNASILFLMRIISKSEPIKWLQIRTELPVRPENWEGITPTRLLGLVHGILNRLGILEDSLSTSAFWLMSPLDTDKSKFLGFQSRAGSF